MRDHPDIGNRVEFISSNDQYTKLTPGTKGTISFVDDMGTIFVNWDDGSSLGMIKEAGDRYAFVKED
jgi:hypothetical protein